MTIISVCEIAPALTIDYAAYYITNCGKKKEIVLIGTIERDNNDNELIRIILVKIQA